MEQRRATLSLAVDSRNFTLALGLPSGYRVTWLGKRLTFRSCVSPVGQCNSTLVAPCRLHRRRG